MSDEVDEKTSKAIKDIWRNHQQDRYKYIGNYRYDTWIFTLAFFVVIAYLYSVASWYDFSMDYYSCDPSPESIVKGYYEPVCENPFYRVPSWKNEQYLYAGEYGTKLGGLFNSAPYVAVLIMALAFLVNHYLYKLSRSL